MRSLETQSKVNKTDIRWHLFIACIFWILFCAKVRVMKVEFVWLISSRHWLNYMLSFWHFDFFFTLIELIAENIQCISSAPLTTGAYHVTLSLLLYMGKVLSVVFWSGCSQSQIPHLNTIFLGEMVLDVTSKCSLIWQELDLMSTPCYLLLGILGPLVFSCSHKATLPWLWKARSL